MRVCRLPRENSLHLKNPICQKSRVVIQISRCSEDQRAAERKILAEIKLRLEHFNIEQSKFSMLNDIFRRPLFLIVLLASCLSSAGCSGIFKSKSKSPVLLKTENASLDRLISEVNNLARINALHAKMDLKFEDNSFAEVGLTEAYRTADCEILVQRPANILFKVKIPVIGADVVQMSSDGETFRVAVLRDNSDGRLKKFVSGTNNADYAPLQQEVMKTGSAASEKEASKNVGAFANLRPQHFTEALLVHPAEAKNHAYAQSAILLEEDSTGEEKSATGKVLRGYYLLDEFQKKDHGSLTVTRRFWFDRVGGVRLVRQQIFDAGGEIESDIVYKRPGNLTETGEYRNMPLRVEITRPKEKYKISLSYQLPESVTVDKNYPAKAFLLENIWGLEEIDLDEKLAEAKVRQALVER